MKVQERWDSIVNVDEKEKSPSHVWMVVELTARQEVVIRNVTSTEANKEIYVCDDVGDLVGMNTEKQWLDFESPGRIA